MKIKGISCKEFRRFKDLTISGLPATAKLVVLMGPNGSGKSALFDAIYSRLKLGATGSYQPTFGSYYDRIPERSDIMAAIGSVDIQFHGDTPLNSIDRRKAVYARSAYRNVPSFSFNQLQKVGSSLDEVRFTRMIDNDQATSSNYMRMASEALADAFEREDGTKTLHQFREGVLAEIRDAVRGLFPELILNSLGDPLSENATFRFDKGGVRGFAYENLSGGEKAAFDLILDLVIKRREYDDTIFCIDEPEAHMSMRVQRKFLTTLYNLIPDNSQLWVSTHSIGMMREAQDLREARPSEVVFLDFSDRDFDTPQEIQPARMDRSMWERMHSVALDDLAELVLPDVLYLCESPPEKSFDADCYNTIFASEHPRVKFSSVGSKMDVERLALVLQKAPLNLSVIPVRDRDHMTDQEVQNERDKGVRVLSRTCIEKYLLDDEVLASLCFQHNLPDTLNDLREIRDSHSDPKVAAQEIRTRLVRDNLSLQIGDNREAFLRDTLAPLIRSDMAVYRELEQDIFGTEGR